MVQKHTKSNAFKTLFLTKARVQNVDQFVSKSYNPYRKNTI